MPRNKKRHGNCIEIGPVARYLVAAVFLVVTGLSYVYLKNQLCATGAQIRVLEHEVAELKAQNEDLQARKASLSTRAVVQRRLKEEFVKVKMIPIPDDRIVRINSSASRFAAGDVRPAANVESVK